MQTETEREREREKQEAVHLAGHLHEPLILAQVHTAEWCGSASKFTLRSHPLRLTSSAIARDAMIRQPPKVVALIIHLRKRRWCFSFFILSLSPCNWQLTSYTVPTLSAHFRYERPTAVGLDYALNLIEQADRLIAMKANQSAARAERCLTLQMLMRLRADFPPKTNGLIAPAAAANGAIR